MSFAARAVRAASRPPRGPLKLLLGGLRLALILQLTTLLPEQTRERFDGLRLTSALVELGVPCVRKRAAQHLEAGTDGLVGMVILAFASGLYRD